MNGDPSGQAFRYEYNLTDHLGNVRVSFSDVNFSGSLFDENTGELEVGEVLQSEHYYPFGMRMGGLSSPISGTENRYRYNGKELHTELNLNWYDYGARMYDPSIGRWNGVDVQAENYLPITPYAYVANNPLIFIDPNGEEIWISYQETFTNKKGKEKTRTRKVRYDYNTDKFFDKKVKNILEKMNL